MIIKYITHTGIEYIFENATNISIDRTYRSLETKNNDEPSVFENIIVEDIKSLPLRVVSITPDGEFESTPYKLVLFTNKDGLSKGLFVFNEAYICNDEGKTISKVNV